MPRQVSGLRSGWDQRRIRRLRVALGLSQERFAQRIGVTAATVSRWERGRTRPRSEALLRLLEELEREQESSVGG